jgi:hypothetical protein
MKEQGPVNRWRFWIGVAVVFLLVLWLLNDILLPFVVGAVIAYFFDPVVARLQRMGLSRTGPPPPSRSWRRSSPSAGPWRSCRPCSGRSRR